MQEFVIQQHQAPFITFLAKDGSSYVQETRFGKLTMQELIDLAGDEAAMIGVVDLGGGSPLLQDITERVAEAYLDEVRGSGMLVRDMPGYVRMSNAVVTYDDEPSYRPERNNGTYQVRNGAVA